MPWLINLLIGLALQVASLLVTSMAQQKTQEAGVRGNLEMGGDLPPHFIFGRYATAGQLRYAGTWGSSGGTPNAYLSRAIEVSCLPIRGFAAFYVDGERVTLADTMTGDLGYAVLEYRKGGKDHLWIQPYLGSQTAPDPLMLAKFGADADRPYAGMIGRGCGYFVVTALVNRELFTAVPDIMAEVDGIALDDPRGDEVHDNPIVAIYTLMQGLSYGGEWVYGPQGITAANFRAANIEAEADKCDALRGLAGGGTERRYRIGMDIAIDEEPHGVILEILKGCAGRWSDLGGVYRFLVGAPGDPELAFTDDDLVISAGQTFDPFPGLESLYNGMTATYPEPDAGWVMTDAPPRYSSALEAEDDGRRLPFSTEFRAVPYPVQVQELMRITVEDARRFRKHTLTTPPEWWELEPLDVVAWTSARNGYADKSFLITLIEDLPTANQFVGLQETDPADYGWDSGLELPHAVTPLVVIRPTPQVMTGWAAAPGYLPDNDGVPRRPTIEVSFAAGLVDVRAVRVQVRLSGATAPVFDGELPYDPDDTEPDALLYATLLPNTAYEVRGKYLPHSGRETLWSNQDEDGTEGAWLAVTTPNILLGAADISIELSDLADSVATQLEWISSGVRSALEGFRRIGSLLEEQDLANYTDRQVIVREIGGKLGALEASFTEVVETALGPSGAIATALSSLYAAMGGSSSQVNIRWQAVAAPVGYSARYAVQAAVDDGSFRAATFMLDVPANPAEQTRIVLDANQVVFTDTSGTALPAVAIEGGELKFVGARAGRISSADGTTMWVDFDNPEIYMEGV